MCITLEQDLSLFLKQVTQVNSSGALQEVSQHPGK